MPMIRTLTTSLAVALLCSAGAFAQSDTAVDLRPHWEAGHKSVYEFWGQHERVTTRSIAGQSDDSSLSVESRGQVTWVVDRVKPDGSYACTMVLDWMEATYQTPDGRKLKSDSRKGSGEPEAMHDRLRAMAGVPLTVEVAADGSITKLTGVDKMKRKAKDAETIPEELDFIETAADLATLVAAPKSLEPGKSWNTDFRWSHELGHLEHDVTYTLAGVEHIEGIRLATVNGKSKLKLDVDRSGFPAGGPQINIRLIEGAADTQVLFDLQRHEAIGRNSSHSETVEMTMRNQNISINVRMTTRVQGQILRISEE